MSTHTDALQKGVKYSYNGQICLLLLFSTRIPKHHQIIKHYRLYGTESFRKSGHPLSVMPTGKECDVLALFCLQKIGFLILDQNVSSLNKSLRLSNKGLVVTAFSP